MMSGESACLPLTYSRKLCVCCPHLPRRLDSENLLILSLIQLLCGSAAIILFGVALTKEGYLHQIGTGVWAGSLMLATGCLGIATSRHRSPCTLISLLVLCVMTSITSAILASISTAGLIQDGVKHSQSTKMHLIVLHTLLFIVGFLECSVAVTTAIICGRQVCFGAIYLPSNSSVRRRGCGGFRRSSLCGRRWYELNVYFDISRNQCSLLGSPSDFPGFANLITGSNTATMTGSLSSVIRNSGQLPVLTTNSFYANVLFPQFQSNSQNHSFLNTSCRYSLVYLLPSANQNEPALLFPPYPPSYSAEENRPLSAYACLNATDSGDALLQPVLLVEEQPPYDSLEYLPDSKEISNDVNSVHDDVVVLVEPSVSMIVSQSSASTTSSSSSSGKPS